MVFKLYFYYRKLDRVRNLCPKLFIYTQYVMDILLLQNTGWGENFIALNFLIKKQNDREKISLL